MPENVPLVVKYPKNKRDQISITHPIDIDCRITNNIACIVYNNLIWLPVTGRSLKQCHQSKYRLTHIQG